MSTLHAVLAGTAAGVLGTVTVQAFGRSLLSGDGQMISTPGLPPGYEPATTSLAPPATAQASTAACGKCPRCGR